MAISRKTRNRLLLVALLAIGVLLSRRFAAKSDTTMVVIGLSCPPLVSDASIASNLDTADRGLLVDSVSMLADRHNAVAMNKAREMMDGPDTWVHGAMYLGHFGDMTAIPYLIKALRHKFASGLYPEIAAELEILTGQHFGQDFGKWHDWWEQGHPSNNFDFDSYLDSR